MYSDWQKKNQNKILSDDIVAVLTADLIFFFRDFYKKKTDLKIGM
jgi:hypothetical protein